MLIHHLYFFNWTCFTNVTLCFFSNWSIPIWSIFWRSSGGNESFTWSLNIVTIRSCMSSTRIHVGKLPTHEIHRNRAVIMSIPLCRLFLLDVTDLQPSILKVKKKPLCSCHGLRHACKRMVWELAVDSCKGDNVAEMGSCMLKKGNNSSLDL